jgi:hypothetical protein
VVGETDSEGVARYLPHFGQAGVPMADSAGKLLKRARATMTKHTLSLTRRPPLRLLMDGQELG